jgi:branched-chain amino acid transport system ATP-binding protein
MQARPASAAAEPAPEDPIEKLASHVRVARGISQSPEGRQVFAPLSVEDNLRLGGYRRRDGAAGQSQLAATTGETRSRP